MLQFCLPEYSNSFKITLRGMENLPDWLLVWYPVRSRELGTCCIEWTSICEKIWKNEIRMTDFAWFRMHLCPLSCCSTSVIHAECRVEKFFLWHFDISCKGLGRSNPRHCEQKVNVTQSIPDKFSYYWKYSVVLFLTSSSFGSIDLRMIDVLY